VKHALRRATGEHFAVKILDRGRVLSLRGADDQVRREIATLTVLRHPNVVRLHEVSNSIHPFLLGLLDFPAVDHIKNFKKKMLRKKDQVESGGLIWKLLTSEHLVYGWKIHAFFLGCWKIHACS
jgi:hypothetical protein